MGLLARLKTACRPVNWLWQADWTQASMINRCSLQPDELDTSRVSGSVSVRKIHIFLLYLLPAVTVRLIQVPPCEAATRRRFLSISKDVANPAGHSFRAQALRMQVQQAAHGCARPACTLSGTARCVNFEDGKSSCVLPRKETFRARRCDR